MHIAKVPFNFRAIESASQFAIFKLAELIKKPSFNQMELYR